MAANHPAAATPPLPHNPPTLIRPHLWQDVAEQLYDLHRGHRCLPAPQLHRVIRREGELPGPGLPRQRAQQVLGAGGGRGGGRGGRVAQASAPATSSWCGAGAAQATAAGGAGRRMWRRHTAAAAATGPAVLATTAQPTSAAQPPASLAPRYLPGAAQPTTDWLPSTAQQAVNTQT